MASAHLPYAKKTFARAARSGPVFKASFEANETKYTKSDENCVINKVDDNEDMISSFLQFWSETRNSSLYGAQLLTFHM